MTVRNRLDETFSQARNEGRGVVIPYLTAGFPERDGFVDLAVSILDAGADALEIGIPFSDPLLDGPSIQRSQQRALEQGITPDDCLRFAADVHARRNKPLLFMGAYNPMLTYGLDLFCTKAASAGVTAILAPDLPYEEQDDLLAAAGAHNLHVIQFVAPTSTDARLQRACARASGFVYCISVAGITGARTSVVDTAQPLVQRVRRCTDVPVAVGFGIAGGQQAGAVAAFADGVIVGSALTNVIAEAPDGEVMSAAQRFVAELCDALQAPARIP
ncbi:MAG: tryptophan synthase subunit alpha [Chloroflexota bacterium]